MQTLQAMQQQQQQQQIVQQPSTSVVNPQQVWYIQDTPAIPNPYESVSVGFPALVTNPAPGSPATGGTESVSSVADNQELVQVRQDLPPPCTGTRDPKGALRQQNGNAG